MLPALSPAWRPHAARPVAPACHPPTPAPAARRRGQSRRRHPTDRRVRNDRGATARSSRGVTRVAERTRQPLASIGAAMIYERRKRRARRRPFTTDVSPAGED